MALNINVKARSKRGHSVSYALAKGFGSERGAVNQPHVHLCFPFCEHESWRLSQRKIGEKQGVTRFVEFVFYASGVQISRRTLETAVRLKYNFIKLSQGTWGS